MLLALLGLGAARMVPVRSSGTLVVDLLPNASGSAAPDVSVAPASEARASAPQVPEPTIPIPRPPPPVATTPEPPVKLDMLELSSADYAASDIGKIQQVARPAAGSGNGGAGDSREAGRGPNGQVLYAAEWARKPTDAELRGFLPERMPDHGWGTIACRTAPGHRVEDCVELENYPKGSHLAGAVRQAAWQFRVRPPRKNGREMIGEWVTIRIEYTRTAIRV